MTETTNVYFHNNDWQILSEYDGSNNHKKSYFYGNYIDEVLMSFVMPINSSCKYYVHDHLYSPAALLYYTGPTFERYEYDAYGNCQIMDASYNPRSSSLYGNLYYFTGRQVDELDGGNLKIQYNRNRYYDYYTGRWLTHDPLGINPGGPTSDPFSPSNQYLNALNLYEYVQDNPVAGLDPLGEFPWKWVNCIFCGAAVVGKLGGSIGGAIYVCKDAEDATDGRMTWGECISKVLREYYSACELWRAFEKNPAEWIGAAACVSCGVTIIKEIMDGPPDGCDDCGCGDEDDGYPIPPDRDECLPCPPIMPYRLPSGYEEICMFYDKTSKIPCVCIYMCPTAGMKWIPGTPNPRTRK